MGFLTLDELIRSWRGRLKDCDLVVLSACDTQRGIKKGDSMMALPWGFFYAGAPTVIASLWKVDDTATQLLMTRFYENLLGSFPDARRAVGQEFNAGTAMPKNLALIEAKTWLRNLTYDERDVTLSAFESSNSDQQKEQDRSIGKTSATAPRGEGKGPYEHPYYWAAFILIGSPT
ncbi:MAG: CHAT domain-containing protein [Planctomycetes bacterium]|nr:CHAT domain-containing protein [Planctomycetota bacterium]